MSNVMIDDERDFWWACVDIKVLRDRELTPYDKTVYAMLCTYASVEGRCCYPSVERIAEEACCSVRAVQVSLRHLEERGYLVRECRYKDRRQIASRYKLVGHRGGAGGAPRPAGNAGGRVQEVHPELEPQELEPESKAYSASHCEETSPEAPAVDPQPENLTLDLSGAGVPLAFKATAEYFMLKTGRRGVTPEDVEAIKRIERYHVPSRIQTEIAKAVERYEKAGKPLTALTFGYIWESVQHQRSKPALRAEQLRKQDPWEKQRIADLDDWERRQQEDLKARFGGEDT